MARENEATFREIVFGSGQVAATVRVPVAHVAAGWCQPLVTVRKVLGWKEDAPLMKPQFITEEEFGALVAELEKAYG
jgi:hypothetical protein